MYQTEHLKTVLDVALAIYMNKPQNLNLQVPGLVLDFTRSKGEL